MGPMPPLSSDRNKLVVLHADIQGYSRLIDRNDSDVIERVSRSLVLICNLIGDYGGVVDNIAGDGVLALFPSEKQALHFAIEMQCEMSNEQAWSSGENAIQYRIGIAAGDTFSGGGTLHGHCINLAVRLQSLAPPGGIYISRSVRDEIIDTVGVDIKALGLQTLKNISDPVEAFSVELSGEPIARQSAIQLSELPLEPVANDSSIAVLPLENLSGDPADVHLCQGISTDLISNLCRFRNLAVIARQSAFLLHMHFGSSARQIGRKLNVRYVLSGSLRRAGNTIRITVDLIDVQSENTVWSERFDGSLADIFAFQDAVTSTTAARLAVQIDMAEKRRLAEQAYPKLHAYGLILRGQNLGFRFRPESNAHARRLFELAREVDPRYGRSYAAMSRTFNVEWRYHWTDDPEGALNEALDLAKLAVQFDELDARGFSEMGIAYLYKKRHDESLAAYERALELNPNDADLLAEMGDCLVYVRQADRAVGLLEQAIRLNPYHPDSYLWYLGDAYFHLGEYRKTIDTLLKMRDQSEGHRLMAASYALIGDLESARHQARAVIEAHPNFTIEKWRNVPPNKYPEDLEIFVEGLRLAGLK